MKNMYEKNISCQWREINKNIFTIFFLIFTTTVFSQNNIQKEILSRDQSKIGFQVSAATGVSSLTAEYNSQYTFTKSQANIGMWVLSVNGGIRFRPLEKTSYHINLGFEYGSGKADPKTESFYFNDMETQDLTTWLIGVSAGVSFPLFVNPDDELSPMSPKIISLDIDLGCHALIIEKPDEASFSFNGMEISGFTQNQIIDDGDWVLFSGGIGLQYLFPSIVGVSLKMLAGTYPISTIVQSSNRNEVGETTWGYYHRIVLGIQLRF